MLDFVMLLSPTVNRVYAGATPLLAAAELRATTAAQNVEPITIAGVEYLSFRANKDDLARIAVQSAALALFVREQGDVLHPVALPDPFTLEDDLVTIPKYQGKTNEQFTQLLVNVTLGAVSREASGRRQILDPLAGRGTTISTALRLGHDAFGVELDAKAFEAMVSFYKTYFRRKRLRHSAEVRRVNRDGKSLGRRFDLRVEGQQACVFTGDARDSAALFGKKRFDAIVTDAPYGVAHGATTQRRDRSPAALLAAAIPVWAGQLKHGGALGIAWNTFGLSREDLAELCEKSGLRPWASAQGFEHRVDASIKRDVFVATKP